jgi:tellurite resistance protein TehA-like permease
MQAMAGALPPNIFAIVMATGIVALAANTAIAPILAQILFWIGVAAYVVLWMLLGTRCVQFRDQVAVDLCSHARAPGFFTLVAGTGVLGNGCVLLLGWPSGGFGMLVLAAVLWAGLTYSILPSLIEAENKPPLEKSLSGVWLLAVVATQSVAVLAGLLAPKLSDSAAGYLLFAAFCLWLIGVMLYIWLIALIFYRMTFLPMSAAELAPPYWINMGAMAISVLAGVTLGSNAHRFALLIELLPFLKGMTLLFWATATWWLPLLVALGIWRHIVKRYPLRYDHGYWGAVFPLGMYSVCTQRLGREFGLEFLIPLGVTFAWIALAAWAATAFGLTAHLLRRS